MSNCTDAKHLDNGGNPAVCAGLTEKDKLIEDVLRFLTNDINKSIRVSFSPLFKELAEPALLRVSQDFLEVRREALCEIDESALERIRSAFIRRNMSKAMLSVSGGREQEDSPASKVLQALSEINAALEEHAVLREFEEGYFSVVSSLYCLYDNISDVFAHPAAELPPITLNALSDLVLAFGVNKEPFSRLTQKEKDTYLAIAPKAIHCFEEAMLLDPKYRGGDEYFNDLRNLMGIVLLNIDIVEETLLRNE